MLEINIAQYDLTKGEALEVRPNWKTHCSWLVSLASDGKTLCTCSETP